MEVKLVWDQCSWTLTGVCILSCFLILFGYLISWNLPPRPVQNTFVLESFFFFQREILYDSVRHMNFFVQWTYSLLLSFQPFTQSQEGERDTRSRRERHVTWLFLSLPKRPEPVLKIEDKQFQCTLGIIVLLASAEILQWTKTNMHALSTAAKQVAN